MSKKDDKHKEPKKSDFEKEADAKEVSQEEAGAAEVTENEKEVVEQEKPKHKEKPETSEGDKILKGNMLVIGSITVMSPNKKNKITLSADNQAAGVWVSYTGRDDAFPDSTIAIYETQDGPVLGFYKDTNQAMNMAFAIDRKTGLPCLQVPNGRGGFYSIGLAEMLDAVKPGWRNPPPEAYIPNPGKQQ